MTQSNSNHLDRLEALVATYVETSAKETAEMKTALAKETAEMKSALNETRKLVHSVAKSAQANSTEIAQLRRERQATDRQIAEVIRLLGDLIATTKADRAMMFEMIQSLNDSQVQLAENLTDIASSLNQLIQKQMLSEG
ncbi:MAG: hypothetical protein AB4426_06865 [Xenococcaceae cyanobacterium]